MLLLTLGVPLPLLLPMDIVEWEECEGLDWTSGCSDRLAVG